MRDTILFSIFAAFTVICFFIQAKLIKEQKKLINLYAQKKGSETYADIRSGVKDNLFLAPLYAIKKSFWLTHLMFKSYEDHDLSVQAAKVKHKFLTLIACFISLVFILIFLGLMMS